MENEAASQQSNSSNLVAVPPRAPKKAYVIPQQNDVKCGRGRKCFEHPGNGLLRVRVAFHLEEYRRQVRAAMKTKVIDSIIADVFAEGGRFLKFDYTIGLWYDGGIQAGKQRIGSAFRDASKTNKVKCMEKLKAFITKKRSCNPLRGLPIPNQTHSGPGLHPGSSAASRTNDVGTSAPNVARRGRTKIVEPKKKGIALPMGPLTPRAPVCHVAGAASNAFLFVPSGVVCVQPFDAST